MSRLVFVPWWVFDKAWELVESLFMPLRKEEKLLSNKRTEKSSSKIIIGYFLFSNCFFRSSSTSLRWVTLASRLQRLKEKKSRFSLEALSSMELEVKSRWIWSTRLDFGYLTSWNKRILLKRPCVRFCQQAVDEIWTLVWSFEFLKEEQVFCLVDSNRELWNMGQLLYHLGCHHLAQAWCLLPYFWECRSLYMSFDEKLRRCRNRPVVDRPFGVFGSRDVSKEDKCILAKSQKAIFGTSKSAAMFPKFQASAIKRSLNKF